jgi:hypothetical protein
MMSATKNLFEQAKQLHEQEETLAKERRSHEREVHRELPKLLLEVLMEAKSLTAESAHKHLERRRILVDVQRVSESLETLHRQKRLKKEGERYFAIQPGVLARHLGETPKSTRRK